MSWARALPDLYGTINATDAMTAALDGVSREVCAKGALFAMFNEAGVEYSDRYTNSAYLGKDDMILKYLQNYGDLEAYCWEKVLSASFGQPVRDLDIWPIGHAFREREDVKYVMNMAGVYRRVAYNLSPEVGWPAGFVFQYCESLQEIPDLVTVSCFG